MGIFGGMKSLLAYLNSLPREEQMLFAQRCGTTVGYLRKACSKGDLLREKVCALAETHSSGAVKRIELRPEDWMEIWPELRDVQLQTTEGVC